jgi:hypothetical protein
VRYIHDVGRELDPYDVEAGFVRITHKRCHLHAVAVWNVMPAHIHRCEADELRSRGRFGCERAYGKQGGREENVSHHFHEVTSEKLLHNLLPHQAVSMTHGGGRRIYRINFAP